MKLFRGMGTCMKVAVQAAIGQLLIGALILGADRSFMTPAAIGLGAEAAQHVQIIIR